MAIDAEGLIGQLQHFAQYEMLRENPRDEMIHLQGERYRCLGRKGFSFLFGVKGSPIAASMTERASRLGSVGFLAGRFFFGLDFCMDSSCHIDFQLSAPSEFKSYQYLMAL